MCKTSARFALAELIRVIAPKPSKELFIVASHFAEAPYKSVEKGGAGMLKAVKKEGPMKTSSQLASENAKSEEADELGKITS